MAATNLVLFILLSSIFIKMGCETFDDKENNGIFEDFPDLPFLEADYEMDFTDNIEVSTSSPKADNNLGEVGITSPKANNDLGEKKNATPVFVDSDRYEKYIQLQKLEASIDLIPTISEDLKIHMKEIIADYGILSNEFYSDITTKLTEISKTLIILDNKMAVILSVLNGNEEGIVTKNNDKEVNIDMKIKEKYWYTDGKIIAIILIASSIPFVGLIILIIYLICQRYFQRGSYYISNETQVPVSIDETQTQNPVSIELVPMSVHRVGGVGADRLAEVGVGSEGMFYISDDSSDNDNDSLYSNIRSRQMVQVHHADTINSPKSVRFTEI